MRYNNTPYEDEGFENRTEYLESLANDFGLPLKIVKQQAQYLGREADFDALPETLQEIIDEALEEMEEEQDE